MLNTNESLNNIEVMLKCIIAAYIMLYMINDDVTEHSEILLRDRVSDRLFEFAISLDKTHDN